MVARGRLHHLEVYVRDLEVSVRFWGWLLAELGYRLTQEWDEGCAFVLEDTSIVFVQAPPGAANLDRRGAGLNHVAFRLVDPDEVDGFTQALRARGVRILYEDRHPHAGGPDHYAVFCEDPDGLKVELVAPMP